MNILNLFKRKKPEMKLIPIDDSFIAGVQRDYQEFLDSPIDNRLATSQRELNNRMKGEHSWERRIVKRLFRTLKRKKTLRIGGSALLHLEPGEDQYYPEGLEGVAWEDVSLELYLTLWDRARAWVFEFWDTFINWEWKYWDWKPIRQYEFYWVLDLEDNRFHSDSLVYSETIPATKWDLEEYEDWKRDTEPYWRCSGSTFKDSMRITGTGRTGMVEADMVAAVEKWLCDNFYIKPGEIKIEFTHNM